MRKKELELEEIKEIELSILKHIKNVCEENNIRYYLSNGTLLGAIRHKGFIPWDDDIDIFMPRTDYMKLMEILENGFQYKCLSIYNKNDYYYPFAKVVDTSTILIEKNHEKKISGLGVYVDVFPIDGIPKSDIKVKFHFRRMLIYRTILYLSLFSTCPPSSNKWKFILKYIVWSFSRLFNWRNIIKTIDKHAMRYDFDNSEKVACIVGSYGKNEIVEKAIFDKGIQVEFEGESFTAPVGYDDYLTNLYGDYMQLPPIEKRVSHHNFVAYYDRRAV